jgi:hypothetical protein
MFDHLWNGRFAELVIPAGFALAWFNINAFHPKIRILTEEARGTSSSKAHLQKCPSTWALGPQYDENTQ